MTSEQFAYWLQGFAELNENPPSPEQWQAIREHLALVFKKFTPPLISGIQGVPYCAPNAGSPIPPRATTTC